MIVHLQTTTMNVLSNECLPSILIAALAIAMCASALSNMSMKDIAKISVAISIALIAKRYGYDANCVIALFRGR